jgi:molybdate transport repressor ModE-like protein
MTVDFSPAGLRVLREVAQSGSFSAAARALGYTQSAISRQVAALEAVAGTPLFERSRSGAVLTAAGARLLPRAARILDELEGARRATAGEPVPEGPVRIGAFASAAAGLLPAVLASLPPQLHVTVREGTTPTLTRALRAGTLDMAIIASAPPRPPDAESPRLELTTLVERELVVAVPEAHPLARAGVAEASELEGQAWVASRSEAGESLLGVWPGLAERPEVRYVVRDWLVKLQLVAAGLAITTLAPVVLPALPPGIAIVRVRGEPREVRRVALARLPGTASEAITHVAQAVQRATAA